MNKSTTTDSVCAAIAYAYLQRQIYKNGCKAIITSPLRDITKFILEKFNQQLPEMLQNLAPRPADILREQLVFLYKTDSLARAMELQSLYKVRMMPVVDKEMKCLGIVTVHNLVQAFISPLDSDDLNTVETNPH